MEHAAGTDDVGQSPADRYALEALRFHWDEAYEVWHDEHGWQARRFDGLGAVITADGPDALGVAIQDDYRMKPVSRDLPESAG